MATPLLNDDGTASMATALMTSHHAFRRDLACFAEALRGPPARADRLADEWKRFRETLHHHHTSEDTGIFVDLRARHLELGGVLDRLHQQHQALDPLLERGDRLFAALRASGAEARELISALTVHLGEHLDLEEPAITPYLRGAKQFPLEATAEVAAAYADGFAWSCAGISEAVLEPLFAMLPPALAARLPAARAAFDQRCLRVWGHAHSGASTTSVPAGRGRD